LKGDIVWRAEPVWVVIQVTESLSSDMTTSTTDDDITAVDVVDQPHCHTAALVVCSVFSVRNCIAMSHEF